MTRVLVTGGEGMLGHHVVSRLIGTGYTVRVMSHRQPQLGADAHIEWAQADLQSGTGLATRTKPIPTLVSKAVKVAL